jgi:hypothetical protein
MLIQDAKSDLLILNAGGLKLFSALLFSADKNSYKKPEKPV